MKVHVSKWGNSLAVRIPKSVAETAGLQEGCELDMTATDSEVHLKKLEYSLESLLRSVTPENIHSEVAWGEPVGKEAW